MTSRATGTFDVELTPRPVETDFDDDRLGMNTLDKQFQGDLEGSSHGWMLGAYGQVEGSAGYVAIERVEGSLAGRRGTFVLQHSGTMSGGGQELSITVVPDSGTGELVGLEGRMSIRIEEGQHHYDFEYALPEDEG